MMKRHTPLGVITNVLRSTVYVICQIEECELSRLYGWRFGQAFLYRRANTQSKVNKQTLHLFRSVSLQTVLTRKTEATEQILPLFQYSDFLL